MNREELILDFLHWFPIHRTDIFELVDNPETPVQMYLEMLDAVEDLNDDNQLKIDFENENI